MCAPVPPATAPLVVVKVPLPAVESLEKNIAGPNSLVEPIVKKVPLPADEVTSKSNRPVVVNVPLPADELSKNAMAPLLVKTVKFPAAAVLKNCIDDLRRPGPLVTKFCVIPELFVMPRPLILK